MIPSRMASCLCLPVIGRSSAWEIRSIVWPLGSKLLVGGCPPFRPNRFSGRKPAPSIMIVCWWCMEAVSCSNMYHKLVMVVSLINSLLVCLTKNLGSSWFIQFYQVTQLEKVAKVEISVFLGSCFKYILRSPLHGAMIQFD